MFYPHNHSTCFSLIAEAKVDVDEQARSYRKQGKPELTSFCETLALFFIQFLSFRKMKIQNRQNGLSGLPEETGWLRA